MSDKTMKYLSVRIGEQWCGINVEHIIEVFHLMAFNEVPTRRSDVLGFITVRAQVMPLIDMRRRFGITDPQLKLDSPIVAIQEESGSVALLFDDINRVEDVEESQVNTMHNSDQFPDINGIVQLPDQLLFLLETDRISREVHSETSHE